jgi:hypothetical protein
LRPKQLHRPVDDLLLIETPRTRHSFTVAVVEWSFLNWLAAPGPAADSAGRGG